VEDPRSHFRLLVETYLASVETQPLPIAAAVKVFDELVEEADGSILKHDILGIDSLFIDGWMERVRQAAAIDVPLAAQLARLRGLVKGYGETYERGLTKYKAIETFILARMGQANASLQLARLIAAAERDEGAAALGSAIEEMSGPSKLEHVLVQAV
jgi:hypothetical protein